MMTYGFTSTSMYGMGWRVLRQARYGWDSASSEQIKFVAVFNLAILFTH